MEEMVPSDWTAVAAQALLLGRCSDTCASVLGRESLPQRTAVALAVGRALATLCRRGAARSASCFWLAPSSVAGGARHDRI